MIAPWEPVAAHGLSFASRGGMSVEELVAWSLYSATLCRVKALAFAATGKVSVNLRSLQGLP